MNHHRSAWVSWRTREAATRVIDRISASSPTMPLPTRGCETHLTEEAVGEFLRPMGIGKVRRYELPRLHAFNFVIDHALAGGASRSLRIDTQGKALGTVLLEILIPSPPSKHWLANLGRVPINEHQSGSRREDRGPSRS